MQLNTWIMVSHEHDICDLDFCSSMRSNIFTAVCVLGVFWYLRREFWCWLGVSHCSFPPSSASRSYSIVPTAHGILRDWRAVYHLINFHFYVYVIYNADLALEGTVSTEYLFPPIKFSYHFATLVGFLFCAFFSLSQKLTIDMNR